MARKGKSGGTGVKRPPINPVAEANRLAWAKRHPERAAEERALRKSRFQALEAWKHKNHGTIETHQHAATVREGALARLLLAGDIDREQLEWADEIAAVAEMIEADVTIRTGDIGMRVDQQSQQGVALIEGLKRVRHQVAYTRWRAMLPMPKRLILDMLTGERIPFSTASRRYGIRHQKVKKLLIAALDRWPQCLDYAWTSVRAEDLDAAHERLA